MTKRKHRMSVKKIAAVIAICFAAVMFINQLSRLNYYNGQIKDLEGKIAEQDKISSDLSSKQTSYTSKEYVEQIARETLGLVRANEKVYIDSNSVESD